MFCGPNLDRRISTPPSNSSPSASAASAKRRRRSPPKPMLKIRVLTASILGAALLVCLFVLPAPWTVLVFAAVFTGAAWEWTGFGALRSRAARMAYTVALAALLAFGWRWSVSPAHLLTLL